MRVLAWVGVWMWCVSLASGAAAQAPADQKAAAEALFDKGLTLMKQGDYARACTYLEQSQAVERGIGTMMYLAECYEKLGRTASAWALFREAASAAQAEGQTERAQVGAARASQLEPQLARLTIVVPPGAQVPGLQVVRNGVDVPSAVWGVAVPVDPGAQRIDAHASGHEPWSQTGSVAKGGTLTVTIPPLQAAVTAARPLSMPQSEPRQLEPQPVYPRSEPVSARSSELQRTAALITGGAGVVALGLGTYFGVRAANENGDAEPACPNNLCSPAGHELHESAQSAATLSNVFVFGGAAFVAAGIVLFVTAPDSPGVESAGLRVEPFGAGLAVRGAM